MTEQTDNDFAEAWVPQPGDTISGTVAAVTLSADMGYGPYPIVAITTSDGERAIHAFHQVLRSELARRRPRPGDELEITYLGKRSPKSGNGNDFHVYRVKGGTEPEFNWDSELPDDERGRQQSSNDPPIPPAPIPQEPGTAAREARERQQAATQTAAAENFGDKPPF